MNDRINRRIQKTSVNEITGFISTGNSTTTPLGANLFFTGDWEEIKDYAIIKVNIVSDQASAIRGLCFQQSPDQTVIFEEEYDLEASNGKLFTPNPIARYFRIVYQNGSVDQGSFSLQTIYSSVYTKPSSHRLGDTVSGNDDTELVTAVIAYKNEVDQDDYKNVGIQNPFPTDGDSAYEKDIWQNESDIGDFSGSVSDLFNNLHTVISDTTANNPKEILIHFNRTMVSNAIGLGAFTGNFSNTEVQVAGSGGVFVTVIDESADSTKYTTRKFRLPTDDGALAFNAIKFRFHTADTVSLSNCVITKAIAVVTRQNGPNGLEYAQDAITGDRISISHQHHEIHEEQNYSVQASATSATSLILAFKVKNQLARPHFTFTWKSEESATVSLYRDPTWTTGTGTDLDALNSWDDSTNVSILQGDATGAFVDGKVVQDPTGFSTTSGTTTTLYQEPVWSTNQAPASPGSGNRNERVLTPDETYAIEISGSPAGGLWLSCDWYEHIAVEDA